MRPEDTELAMRCTASVARAVAEDVDDAELDATVAGLQRLRAGLPGRGTLAGGLVLALIRNANGPPQRLRHLDALIAIADDARPGIPDWPRVRATGRALAIGHAGTNGTIPNLSGALAELDELTAEYGDDVAMRGLFVSVRAGVALLRALETGDEATVRRMPSQVQALRELAGAHPQLGELMDFIDNWSPVISAQQAGDTAGALVAAEQVQAMTSDLPAGHVIREAIDDTVTMMAPFRSVLAARASGSFHAPSDQELARLVGLTQRPDAPVADRALFHHTTGQALLAAGQESDPARIEEAIGHLRQAVDWAGPDNQHRALYLQSLAMGLYRRTEVRGGIAGLNEVLAILDQAERLADGPHHPQWQVLNELRSAVLRRLGDSRASRTAALDGMRGYAWQGLVQADTAAAKISIRGAAADAIDLARQCIGDNSPEDALRALDAGRGLLLFAATGLRDIGVQLDTAGSPDLALRWRQASDAVASAEAMTELRREVISVLSTDPTTMARLLDPPSLAEIRSALRTLDADALVYLVPGQPTVAGMAVIAPADGPVSYLMLPELVVDTDVDVERYLTALAQRDLTPVEAQDELAGSLDILCDWAWRAAMGPLVDSYFGTRDAPNSGQVPRVMLVPMGDLARIPWQAARRKDGIYATQLVAFSHVASARMLCDAAARSVVPILPVGLVVADPDTAGRGNPLTAARLEAHTIHQAFYRGARYVGRLPDGSTSRSGPGSAADVRSWLTSTSPAAGAMLHLACHGNVVVNAEAPKSFLALATDKHGEELSAEELIGVMARAPQRAIGLVVLAACRTGTSIHGYDEAYSLGTAFLAGGVRSVLSTQWRIPDATTASLMFMFHHYLRHDGMPVWRALRQAQLWMLDPHRQPLPEMPAELYLHTLSDDHAQVVAWAGFVHWGQ